MSDPITKQELINASLDANTLEAVVNNAPNEIVTARLGNSYHPLSYYLAQMNAAVGNVNLTSQQKIAELQGIYNSASATMQQQLQQFLSNLATQRGVVNTEITNLQQAIQTAAAAGAGANGWIDLLVVTANGRTLRDKLKEVLSVKDFGAVGDGVTDDTIAIQNALNAVSINGGVLNFDGVYKLADNTSNSSTYRLVVTGDNVTLNFSSRTQFLLKSETAFTECLVLQGVSNIRLQGMLRVKSTGTFTFDSYGGRGAKALVIKNANNKTCENFLIDGVELINGSTAVAITCGYPANNRVKDVTIGVIKAVNVTYGLNCLSNGDNVTFNMLHTVGCYRSLFAYDVKNYTGSMRVVSPVAYATPINLTRYAASTLANNTENFKINLELIDPPNTVNAVNLRHIGDGGSSFKINNINVNVVSNAALNTVLAMNNFSSSGSSESTDVFAASIDQVVITYKGVNQSTVLRIDNSSWQALPNVKTLGVSANIGTFTSFISKVNWKVNLGTNVVLQDQFVLTDNGSLRYLDAANNSRVLVQTDTNKNIIFGNSVATGTYTVLHGGNAVYINTLGLTRLAITENRVSPISTEANITLGSTSQQFNKLHLSGGLGVFGSTPPSKPTVTGSIAGNAALQSLLTALTAYGLITNSTTN